MANTERERFEYVYELTREQKERLLEIALRKDQPLEQVILEAIDRYIAAEKKLWPQKT